MVTDNQIEMPHARRKGAASNRAGVTTKHQNAPNELAIEVGVPGEVNGLVFKDCIFVNERNGHDAPLSVLVIENCTFSAQ